METSGEDANVWKEGVSLDTAVISLRFGQSTTGSTDAE